MIEARAFVGDIESARKKLIAMNAELMGAYRIHDIIFRNAQTNVPLSEEFLRLRHVPINIWNEKPVILAIKRTKPQKLGKLSDIPVKLQFDTEAEAHDYYEHNLRTTFAKDFEFWRDGWQYHLPNGDVVDLEIVNDNYPTIEFKAETDAGIQSLVKAFGVKPTAIITGPSVSAVRDLVVT